MLEYKIKSYNDDIMKAKENYDDLKRDFDNLKRK